MVNCGLEEQGEHSCVLYVKGKIVRQEEVWWPYVFIYIPVFILWFASLGYMVDSCGYKSRVIKGVTAILADW